MTASKADWEKALMMNLTGDAFCDTLTNVENNLIGKGWNHADVAEVIIGAHMGAILAYYSASTGSGRGPLLEIINGMLDDMGVGE